MRYTSHTRLGVFSLASLKFWEANEYLIHSAQHDPRTTDNQNTAKECCPFPFSPSTCAEQGLLNSANRKVIPLNSSFQPQTGTTLQSRSQGNNASGELCSTTQPGGKNKAGKERGSSGLLNWRSALDRSKPPYRPKGLKGGLITHNFRRSTWGGKEWKQCTPDDFGKTCYQPIGVCYITDNFEDGSERFL